MRTSRGTWILAAAVVGSLATNAALAHRLGQTATAPGRGTAAAGAPQGARTGALGTTPSDRTGADARPPAIAEARTPPAPAGARSPVATASPEQLDQEIEDLEARMLAYEEITIDDAILYAEVPFGEKLRLMADRLADSSHAPEFALQALERLGDAAGPAVLEVLRSGRDTAALALLARALADSDHRWLPKQALPEAADALRHGDRPERRALAARLLIQGAGPGELEAFAGPIAQAVREEPDDGVTATVLEACFLARVRPAAELLEAVRVVAARAEPGRATCLADLHVACATLGEDGGAELYERWQRTSDPRRREQIATALGLAGTPEGCPPGFEGSGPFDGRHRANLSRFLSVYQGTADANTRAYLVAAAVSGLCVAAPGEETARMYEQLSALETNAEMCAKFKLMAQVRPRVDGSPGNLDPIRGLPRRTWR